MKPESTPRPDWLEGQFQSWLVAQARAAGFRTRVPLKRKSRIASIVADPDWPDLELLRVSDKRHIYIELKARGGKLSPGQLEVLTMLRQVGREVYVWTPLDWETALQVLAPEYDPMAVPWGV